MQRIQEACSKHLKYKQDEKWKQKKNKKRHTIFSAQLWTMIYNKKKNFDITA